MLLLSTEKTEILLAFKKRRKADKRFFIMAKKHFTFEHVSSPVLRRSGMHTDPAARCKTTRTSPIMSGKASSSTQSSANLCQPEVRG